VKEVSVTTWCDLAASRGEKAEARDTPYVLSFNGTRAELDLSDVAVKEIADILAPYFAMGRIPVEPRKHGRKPGPQGNASASNKERCKHMREFAAENGYDIPKNRGGYYYSIPLQIAYGKHLAALGKK
jgi:Lsr2